MKPLPVVADCQGCGVCCMHMGYPAFLVGDNGQPPEESWVTLPDPIRMELLAFIDGYQVPEDGQLDGPCVWLDRQTKQCKHHEHRPRVCRDFQVGSVGCIDWRNAYGIDH